MENSTENSMDVKKIVIPEGVVNPTAYKKYLVYKNHPILRDKFIKTSDGGEINLGMATHHFKRYIAHLSPKEQEMLLDMKTKYNSLLMKRCVAKSTAFGNQGKKQKDRYTAFEGDIIELLGRMFTIAEVVKIMGEDNEVITTEEEVRAVLRKNIAEIERKREEFRNKVADVRLYNKRPRLEELAWMYSKMKMRYVSLNSTEAYNAMLRTLEQLRKESEGDVLNVNGAIDMNVNVEINAHIQKEMLKTMNLKEVIIARVASRMNYNPVKLIAGLHNSYYHKFVQISGDYAGEEEMQYPSLINYDFNEIEKRNESIDDVVDIQEHEPTEQEHEKAASVKNIFLAKIRKQREEAEKMTSTYSDELTMERGEVKEDYEGMADRMKVRGAWATAKDKVPPSKTKGTGKKL